MKLVRFVAFFLLLVALFGCEVTVETDSFLTNLTSIDSCIQKKDYTTAFSLLKKASKNAYRPIQKISIVKRAFSLEQNHFAEKYLKKSIKQFPDHKELLAIYVHFLIRNNRQTEALQYAKQLQATSYESLLAEIEFNNVEFSYTDEKYLPYFNAAYKATNNYIFLQNSLVIYALQGRISEGLKLITDKDFLPEDFLAQLYYDGGKFRSCIETITNDTVQGHMLLADSYMHLSLPEEALAHWKYVYQNTKNPSPELHYNIARCYLDSNDIENAVTFIENFIKVYPDYELALILYGQMALQLHKTFDFDEASQVLFAKGLKTLDMIQFEKLRTIPLYEPKKKMDESLKRNHQNMLAVENLKYSWILDETSTKQKENELWLMLENDSTFNYTNDYLYQTAVHFFVTTRKWEEALRILKNYCKIDFDTLMQSFNEGRLNSWQKEYAAYLLATYFGNIEDAILLYEDVLTENKNNIYARINLGKIYEKSGNYDKAIEVFSDSVGFIQDSLIRSDIFYSLGNCFYVKNEFSKAKIYLEKSIELNPNNAKTRRLLGTL